MPRTTSLTFTRLEGEAVIIDHDITVRVHHCKNGKTGVTIEAPDDVDVLREELDGVIPVEGQEQDE
ncbi:carbon storage regulator [Marinobacterium stanieri]|uniref:carbon storage regulator n=1 Tax=Marinobacterium stanieri TaxID=49186 RepID=UPI000255A8AC